MVVTKGGIDAEAVLVADKGLFARARDLLSLRLLELFEKVTLKGCDLLHVAGVDGWRLEEEVRGWGGGGYRGMNRRRDAREACKRRRAGLGERGASDMAKVKKNFRQRKTV